MFIKDSLPYKIRRDLFFKICCGACFQEKENILYSFFDHNPACQDLYANILSETPYTMFFDHNPACQDLYANILSETPYTMLFAGDFNAHCQQWWPSDDTNAEGTALDNLESNLNLSGFSRITATHLVFGNAIPC